MSVFVCLFVCWFVRVCVLDLLAAVAAGLSSKTSKGRKIVIVFGVKRLSTASDRAKLFGSLSTMSRRVAVQLVSVPAPIDWVLYSPVERSLHTIVDRMNTYHAVTPYEVMYNGISDAPPLTVVDLPAAPIGDSRIGSSSKPLHSRLKAASSVTGEERAKALKEGLSAVSLPVQDEPRWSPETFTASNSLLTPSFRAYMDGEPEAFGALRYLGGLFLEFVLLRGGDACRLLEDAKVLEHVLLLFQTNATNEDITVEKVLGRGKSGSAHAKNRKLGEDLVEAVKVCCYGC